ncbi:MAG: hypothetical protein EZS26_002235 [Candidatus Ordinivivax streblomastigis]|uniref:Cadherin-like beta-sandwich-like domain-containing protein n=1 Tax=Candidatus Ordinivivax streblomastigis TaxID=2540710 RepID=A0A5M8NZP1_9BACT|nr:MAG: hypothetical protein EZS26_002235 [Candidatus Ordinivivax streblomastigis]
MKKILFTLCLAVGAATLAFGQTLVIHPLWANDENWQSDDYLINPDYVMNETFPGSRVYSCTLTLNTTYTPSSNQANTNYYYLIETTDGSIPLILPNPRLFTVSANSKQVTFYATTKNGSIQFVNDAQTFTAWTWDPGVTILFDAPANGKRVSTTTYNISSGKCQFKFQLNAKKTLDAGDWSTQELYQDFTNTGAQGGGEKTGLANGTDYRFIFNYTTFTTEVYNPHDATLRSLTLSKGTLSPVFASATTAYTASVGYDVSTVNITAITSGPDANVTDGEQVLTVVGAPGNVFVLTVTAADATTTKDYTVTITRNEPLPEAEIVIVAKTTASNWVASAEYSMTKTGDNLYRYQAVLDAGTYSYNAMGKNFESGGGSATAADKTFVVDTDNTTVTFYAKVTYTTDLPGTLNTIRVVCDAQTLYTNYLSSNLTFPSNIGQTATSLFYDFGSAASGNTEFTIAINLAYDYWQDFANNQNAKKYKWGVRGKSLIKIDYTNLFYTLYKVLDGIQNPKIQIGTSNTYINATDISSNIGVYSDENQLLLGGSLEGYINTANGTKINMANINAANLYYTITPTASAEGKVQQIPLTSSVTGDVTVPLFWSPGVSISNGLTNGSYTLKFWYETDCYGDILTDNNGGNYYTATFTVRNPITTTWTGGASNGDWGDAGNWDNGVPLPIDNIVIPAGGSHSPSIPNETIIPSLTLNPNAEVTLAGKLTVTDSIRVNYTVAAANEWYSIGFPFDIAKVYSEHWDTYLTANQGGNFWLKKYTGATFDLAAVENIEANKGYIFQFPSGFEGETITFISEPEQVLTEGTIADDASYQLLVNPTLRSYTLDPTAAHYYTYANNAYSLLTEEGRSIAPFEAVITLKNTVINPAPRLTIEDGTPTIIGNIPTIVNDPVEVTRYYTLQGAEIRKPIENGIYIVKKVYASQREETAKFIYTQK